MSAQPQPQPQQGTLYDLAYKRYEGPRSGTTWRFLVIVRHAVLAQLRSRWVKGLLVFGLVALAFKAAAAALQIVSGGMARQIAGTAGANPLDAKIGEYIVEGSVFAGFLIVLVGGAPAIASDLNAGAFQFYFSRPVSRPQYLLARVLGTAAWPLALALLSLCVFVGAQAMLADPGSHALVVGAKAVGPMLLRILVLASLASGVSSLTRRRGLAQAMFAGIIVASVIVTTLVVATTHEQWVTALGPTGSAEALGAQAFGSTNFTGWHAAVPGVACAAWITVFLALAWWRLARAEVVRG